MLYMVTFTINIPPMLVYIPYMDPMGIYGTPICIGYPHLCHQTSPTVPKSPPLKVR